MTLEQTLDRTLRIRAIAIACHEANRAYCFAIGDDSQHHWEDAGSWQQDSMLDGVRNAMAGASPRQMHDAWCARKFAEGWTRGDFKEPHNKKHPCLVPYDELPDAQRKKDLVIVALVNAMATALGLPGEAR